MSEEVHEHWLVRDWRADIALCEDYRNETEMRPLTLGDMRAVVKYIDTLPPLGSALSDEQIDEGIRAVEALRIMRKVWTPEEKRDAFLRAARGGG